jgi:hypothetical protein
MGDCCAGDPESRIETLVQAHNSYPNYEDGHPCDEVLVEVQTAVEQSGSIGKSDIGALMLWKRLNLSTRWTRALNNMKDQEVREITRAAIVLARNPAVPVPDAAKAAREALVNLPGCRSGQAIASTILTAGVPKCMAVYDHRAAAALIGLGCPDPNGDYTRYMATLGALVDEVNNARKLGWCPRDVDKALFVLGDGLADGSDGSATEQGSGKP